MQFMKYTVHDDDDADDDAAADDDDDDDDDNDDDDDELVWPKGAVGCVLYMRRFSVLIASHLGL